MDTRNEHNSLILPTPCQPGSGMDKQPTDACLLDLLDREQPASILLVRGNAAYHMGPSNLKQLIEPQIHAYLYGRGLSPDHLIQISGFYKYPTKDDVQRVTEQINEHDADLVIGVGGGMAMDIAFWSVNATPESRQYSKQALTYLLSHIVEAVHRATEENRRAMMLGACYAGMAINIAKTTWAHAASYWLTANKDISHGHAVMLTLPYLFPLIDEADEQTLQKTGDLTVDLLRVQMSSLYHMLGVSDGRGARDLLHRIMGDCGLERHINRLDVNPSEFEDIVDAVNPERMKNMPITISRETALNIMYQASRI